MHNSCTCDKELWFCDLFKARTETVGFVIGQFEYEMGAARVLVDLIGQFEYEMGVSRALVAL